MLNSEMNKEDNVLQLIKHFYSGTLNFAFSPENAKSMSWEKQETFLKCTVNNDAFRKYPMSNEFCRLFFKKFIGFLEPYQEIHDDFYKFLCLVLESSQEVFCYRHYILGEDLENKIIIKETKNMVINGTTGMKTWQAALMLADWALSNKSAFEEKNIVELGSGVGFTGIVIAKKCNTKSILLTDCHSDVLRAISENIQINFPNAKRQENDNETYFEDQHLRLGVMNLDWNQIEDLPQHLIPDVLIGADIIYDPTILEPLCNVLKAFFNRNTSLEVYISNIIRNEDTYKSFINIIDSMNFSCEEISQTKSIFIQWDSSIERCLLRIKLK